METWLLYNTGMKIVNFFSYVRYVTYIVVLPNPKDKTEKSFFDR